MRRPALACLALLAVAPTAALAQQGAAGGAPTGLTASVSLGGGGELGLEAGEGKAGVLEAEVAIGYEIRQTGVRPELAVAFGVEPDSHVALRPGVRWTIPGFPIQLRAALDASNARGAAFGWRWLLVGAATEVRLTSLLGLFGEVDTGAPLASDAGLPLLLRAGASFRF